MSVIDKPDTPGLRIVGEAQIAKLQLTAGDVLVVKVDRVISSDVANRIHTHVKPHLPDGVKILVIDAAIELSVLTRTEIAKMAR